MTCWARCRDKDTGKPRGFAFLAYEDQRSTVLAVDNLSGARIGKRTVKVDHVLDYKKKKAEVRGAQQQPVWSTRCSCLPAHARVKS